MPFFGRFWTRKDKTVFVFLFLLMKFSFALEIDFTAIGVEGKTVQFYDASRFSGNLEINSYLWDFGDGETSTEKNPLHTYGAEGTYTVCLSVNGLESVCKQDTFFVLNEGIWVRYDDTVWPNGKITMVSSPFGPRWQQAKSRYDFHRGIDIPGNMGDPVISIADGVVHTSYTEDDPDNTFNSTVVVIQHTMETPMLFHGKFIKTYFSISSHLNDIANGIQKGTTVKKGDVIGTVGHTGDTDFDHNHFEIRVGVLCSRESQQKGNCLTANPFDEIVDPHVNPLLFLDYAAFNTNSLRYEILEEHPLVVKITSNRHELDFNRIEIEKGTERKVLDFNLRQGINPENIDDNPYEGMAIEAGLYTTNGAEDYEITLTFNEFDSADAIVISDIWGSGLNILDGEEKTIGIFPYPNPFSERIHFAQLSENGEYGYQLFDATGSMVREGKVGNTVPAQYLSNGLYYLKLIDLEKGNTKTFKLLKR
ncbi:peptidoglycan DD-metalloendopeptidase family protein [Flagellimonas sp.]|uniref:peptidoglycan DD-metalloendopeptidase family protein n=1 Tax=Flagellimonas sp. TaxID=2058762 RepID=UPI003B5150BB